ncbi:hypothetical protein QUA81_11625 [Microcoleus sp. F6_B4]
MGIFADGEGRVLKLTQLPIEKNGYQLIEGRRHKRRTNNAIVSQANKGFGNLQPGFFVLYKRLQVTLTAACVPRTQPAP